MMARNLSKFPPIKRRLIVPEDWQLPMDAKFRRAGI
jgi:hypothetical protein